MLDRDDIVSAVDFTELSTVVAWTKYEEIAIDLNWITIDPPTFQEIKQFVLDQFDEDASSYIETSSFDSGVSGYLSWPWLTQKQGFIDYNDSTWPINIVADTWTTIPNDGLWSFTNKTHKPDGITELINTTTWEIDVTELELGDTILIRNDFTVSPNTNNALLEFRYALGAWAWSYTLETNLWRLDDGSGKTYRFSLKPDAIYMGDTNTRDNPIALQIKLSTDWVLTNTWSFIQLLRGKLW